MFALTVVARARVTPSPEKVAMIGLGALGGAILRNYDTYTYDSQGTAIKRPGYPFLLQKEDIILYDVNPANANIAWARERGYIVAPNLTTALRKAAGVALCMKPGDVEAVVGATTHQQLIISFAAGITIRQLEGMSEIDHRLSRGMASIAKAPNNTPYVLLPTGLRPGYNGRDSQSLSLLYKMQQLLGPHTVLTSNEAHIGNVCVMGACSPAVFALLIEELIENMRVGTDFSYIEARQIVIRTLQGTLQEMELRDTADIVKAVATPGGLTAEIITAFDKCRNIFGWIIRRIYGAAYALQKKREGK